MKNNSSPPKLGLIGIGLLGSALAERFLDAGFHVIGFDIEPSRRRRLVEMGGEETAGVQEILTAERVVLSLPTSDVVRTVIDEIEPALTKKPSSFSRIVIDTTTGDPLSTASLGKKLADLGVEYLDATVAGSSEQARRKGVIVMAGGERETFEKCRDVFDCFSKQMFHVGPWGAGAKMKLVVNLVLGLHRAVLAEGLHLAHQCGFDLNTTLEVLRASPAFSAAMDSKGHKMITEDFSPQARLAQHLKDVRLIRKLGEHVSASLPLSSLHEQLLQKAVELGFGDSDNSAIIKAFDGKIDV